MMQKILLELCGIWEYNPQPRRISMQITKTYLLVCVDIVLRDKPIFATILNVIKIDTFRADST